MIRKIGKGMPACMLVLVMALLLTACGGSKKKDISGTYHATYNMAEALNKELADTGMTINSEVNAGFTLELNEDDSFSFDIDGEGFRTTFTGVLEKDGPEIIKTMLAAEGITEDMYDTVASASGYESFDAFTDDMVKTIVSEMGDEFVTDLETQVHYEGSYSVDGSMLTLTGEVNEEKGMDQGTINEDGTISVSSKMDDATVLDLTFSKAS